MASLTLEVGNGRLAITNLTSTVKELQDRAVGKCLPVLTLHLDLERQSF